MLKECWKDKIKQQWIMISAAVISGIIVYYNYPKAGFLEFIGLWLFMGCGMVFPLAYLATIIGEIKESNTWKGWLFIVFIILALLGGYENAKHYSAN